MDTGCSKARAKEVMTNCLEALPSKAKENLRYHLKAKTPILCGRAGKFYTDGKGAG